MPCGAKDTAITDYGGVVWKARVLSVGRLEADDVFSTAGQGPVVLIGRVRHIGRHTFASLASPNYRLFFGGVIVSTTGTWIELIAENWLIVRLGGSGLALGVNTAVHLVPNLLLGPYAGVLLDRWDTRRVLLVAQVVAGCLATVMGLITLAGVVQTWMVWIGAGLAGCVNAFHSPARESLSAELVDTRLVANAVALTTAVVVSARAVGPAIGGLLIAGVGVAACFLINAASYAVGVAALRAMNPRQLTAKARQPRASGQVVAVLRHVWRHPALRAVLVMITIAGILGSNVQLLLTLLATTGGRGPVLYGLMVSCLGCGMVTGSLVSAGWHRPKVRGIGFLALAMGGAYLLTALTRGLAPLLMVIAALGVVTGMFFASSSGSLQLNAGSGTRGRVMALYVVASLGPAALGGPLIGWVAATWNVQVALMITGVSCLAACLAGIRRHGSRAPRPAAEPEEHRYAGEPQRRR